MAAQSLYTAVHWYLQQLRVSYEKELWYNLKANEIDPQIVPKSKVDDSKRRLSIIDSLIENIPEGLDDVPIPLDWLQFTTMRKKMRLADNQKKKRSRAALRRIRYMGTGGSGPEDEPTDKEQRQ